MAGSLHVPVCAETLGLLQTTHQDLVAALRKVVTLPYAPRLEVETYTWPVMPDETFVSPSLTERITQELRSASDLLAEFSG